MSSPARSALCLGFMTFLMPAHAQNDPPKPPTAAITVPDDAATISTADRRFLEKAMQANLANIETGTLAWSKGSHGEIKLLGRKTYDAHSKTLRELQSLARKKSIDIARLTDAAFAAKTSDLARASGEEFDRMYIKNAGLGDSAALKRLFTQGTKSKDPDIRAFARKALAHMDEHLKMAQALSTRS